jgi:hypothetical protein
MKQARLRGEKDFWNSRECALFRQVEGGFIHTRSGCGPCVSCLLWFGQTPAGLFHMCVSGYGISSYSSEAGSFPKAPSTG